MTRFRLGAVAVGSLALMLAFAVPSRADGKKSWSLKADYIEACSCHLFCPCYFNTGPEGGHMCEFNNAVRIAEGHVGDVKVDGCKFWMSGDLGGDFSKGEMKTAIITFDTAVTKEQQEAIQFLVGKVYPVKFQTIVTDVAAITWEKKEDGSAWAKLGDKAEVKLTPVVADGKQTVVRDLKYWGAQKNTGFYLCKSEHWYKGHGFDYRHSDKNGFCIRIESEGEEDVKK